MRSPPLPLLPVPCISWFMCVSSSRDMNPIRPYSCFLYEYVAARYVLYLGSIIPYQVHLCAIDLRQAACHHTALHFST